MICALCQNPANTELHTLCKRSVCLSCATAIADALPLLKTQPSRRHAICMRLQENGVRVMAASQQVKDLAEWGVTDEQITGACDIAKERNGFATFGYVYGILKNERNASVTRAAMRQRPVAGTNAETPGEILPGPPVKAKEEWERQGFANQADYESCHFAFDQAKRKGRRDLTWAQHKQQWMGVV